MQLEDRPQRIDWWGGTRDVTKEGLLRPLLAQTVVQVEHATLDGSDTWDEQDPRHLAPENVVFTLADGKRWELLDTQSSDMQILLFKEVKGNDELVTSGDLERGPEEQPFTIPLEGRFFSLPWIVAGITEVWTKYEDHPFLNAVILWSDPRLSSDPLHSSRFGMTPLLAIYVAGDDFWITTAEKVFVVLESDLFAYRNMSDHFYDTRRLTN